MSPLVAVPIEIGERRRPLQNLSLLAQKQLQDGDLLLHRRPGLLLSLQLGKPIEQARINRLGECRRLACLRFRGHRITQSMTTIVAAPTIATPAPTMAFRKTGQGPSVSCAPRFGFTRICESSLRFPHGYFGRNSFFIFESFNSKRINPLGLFYFPRFHFAHRLISLLVKCARLA